MTWDAYLRRARLLAAMERLTTTDSSVCRIAGEVGYESQSAFAKAFVRLTGSTPHAFRASPPGRDATAIAARTGLPTASKVLI